jgi:hypothetical protein
LLLWIISYASDKLSESSNVVCDHSIGLLNFLIRHFMLRQNDLEFSLVLFKHCAFISLSLVHKNQIFDSIEVLDLLDGFSIDILFLLSQLIQCVESILDSKEFR